MEDKLLLVKSITLLYRESQLATRTANSADLVRTVLEGMKVAEVGLGLNSDREVILALKNTALEMCSNPADHDYDENELLQRLHVNCGEGSKLYESFEQGIKNIPDDGQLKRTIINIQRSINNHFREQKIEEVLNMASYKFRHQRQSIRNVNDFITEVLGQLEPLQISSSSKDPAVMNDVDLGNEEAMTSIFREVKELDNGNGIMKFGWQALNRMLQGGIRRGEFMLTPALQHKYKTGFTLSLFKQVALYNTPYMIDKTKKPLLLRISFEDDLALNLKFLYQSLKYDEMRTIIDTSEISIEEMSAYVKQRLQVNGYHIRMMRVDPTQWNYRNICNKIIELEAQGYEIHLMMLDYLGMVPTTGCITTGPSGTDMRDLFRRVRNYCAIKKIAVITPHQLSTEAKQLIRSGLPEDQFVKEIAEKGYFAGSKQLDQEVDIEVYVHLFKHNKETYLAIQRGKHRITTIVDDAHKYYLMKFPKKMPIPDDIEGEDISMEKLAAAASNAAEDTFKFK